MTSAVLIIPEEFRQAGNTLGENLNWGPNNYSVPLSPTGNLPATHWGCRVEVTEGFFNLLENPPNPEAEAILQVVHIDFKETDAKAEHFKKVIDALGLVIITGDQDD